MIGAERVDFIAVPVRDRERADRFYGDVLGLERNPHSSERWIEYETGNVTLALVDPASALGREFQPLPFGAIAIRVDDVAEAKRALEEAGVEVTGEVWDSGACKGAMFTDSEGNGLLLHRRYAPFPDGRQP